MLRAAQVRPMTVSSIDPFSKPCRQVIIKRKYTVVPGRGYAATGNHMLAVSVPIQVSQLTASISAALNVN